MIGTKGALYEYMLAHPELVLEHCRGTRNNGWWWLREGDSSNTTPVHGNAAHALRRQKLVVRTDGGSYMSSRYRLVR